ncbi:hypothetical protein F4810DRAFT_719368 [Camillea tinctor]|nr:hypothetical protein F4810DRAFT_719368 [Camillea tinctor]
MPSETTISTPLPPGTSPQAVIFVLHNHELYIRTTCPQLISYELISPGPAATPPPSLNHAAVYSVTDKRPIGQTTYTLTLTRVADGVDAVVDGRAPGGGALAITSRWRVRAAVLEEQVEIESNLLMKKMVKGNVEKSHPEQHRGFLAEAARAEG